MHSDSMAKSGLEACVPDSSLSSYGSAGKGTVGTWEPVPLASHTRPVIPIPHLISPQTSSHLKAAVSKSPLANASTQERFLPTPLEVYCLEPRFSARREPSSVPPTLCGLHAVLGREGREGGSQAALAQRCVSAQVPQKLSLWAPRGPGACAGLDSKASRGPSSLFTSHLCA